MSDTTISSDSSIQTFDLTCDFVIEEVASSASFTNLVKLFYPLFHSSSICQTGSISNEFKLNLVPQSVTCNCIKGLNSPNNYDGIRCFKNDGTNFDNTLSNAYKFILKKLALSASSQELIIDACMRGPDPTNYYVMGPRVILSFQSPSIFISTSNVFRQFHYYIFKFCFKTSCFLYTDKVI